MQGSIMNKAVLLATLALMIWGIFDLSDLHVNAQDYPNTPTGVTQKLFDAIQENDANKYLDTIIQEDRGQPSTSTR